MNQERDLPIIGLGEQGDFTLTVPGKRKDKDKEHLPLSLCIYTYPFPSLYSGKGKVSQWWHGARVKVTPFSMGDFTRYPLYPL